MQNEENLNKEETEERENHSPEVEQELSQVATNPKQNIIILLAIGAIFLYLFFNLFINSNEQKKEEVEIPDKVSTPTQNTEIDVPSIPTLPTPPRLDDLAPPPPPTPSAPAADSLPELPQDVQLPSSQPTQSVNLPFSKVEDDKSLKRKEKKRKSNIILLAGSEPTKTAVELQQAADFKYRGNMNLILGRGKIIDSVVESAINTDFGGEIRALINKDVYSEWGKNILVPKGSRVFGNYSTSISGAHGHVSVIWTRIDLANGYSVNLNGSTIDNLGRAGHQGRVDNKFKERLGNAVLRSAFNIALANVLDDIVEPQLNSSDSTTQTTEANNIQNIANTIFIDPSLSDSQKFTNICAQTQASITDKTSSAFVDLQTTCNNLQTSTATDPEKLTALMNSITLITTSLIQDTTTDSEQSQAQKASEEAYDDISETLKSFVEEQDFKPTLVIFPDLGST